MELAYFHSEEWGRHLAAAMEVTLGENKNIKIQSMGNYPTL